MDFDQSFEYDQLRHDWHAVRIIRPVRYSLFTFGDSDLPYYLLCGPNDEHTVAVQHGSVKITRPLIITAANAPPDLVNFFEDREDEQVVRFMMSRTAQFQNLKFDNVIESQDLVSDSIEELAARIGKRLDDEEEDRVAILGAPHGLGGLAVLRYCFERMAESASDNLNEMNERGMLP